LKFTKEIESGITWGINGSIGAGLAHTIVVRNHIGERLSETILMLGCTAFLVLVTEKIILPMVARSRAINQTKVPPLNAEYLFHLFMEAKNCDALVGDLEERYKLIHKKFGMRRANFWYWSQALSSVLPIVWAAMKRATRAAMGITALVEFYRKIRS
jgi:hypothetical protein